jgi:hypothetical protein
VVVLFNFSTQDRTIQCPVPTTGTWYVQFNSDWLTYGPDFASVGPTMNVVTADFVDGGASVRANVAVAAHSVVILARSSPPPTRLTDDGDADGLADGWEDLTGVTSPAGDVDNDGISNLQEYELGFDPNEADPTTVAGQFNGWDPAGAVMRATTSADVLHYLYVTEEAAPLQEMKFLFTGAWYGTSTNPVVASPNAPGNNITYNAPEQGYAYFTFNTATKAYTAATFTPASRVDADSDGMDDRWETWHGQSSPTANPDGDAFTNVQEFQRGSHPTIWNRPQLALAGAFNGWNESASPLTYFWHNNWHLDLLFRNGETGLFKFTDGTWSNNWGDNASADGIADSGGADIVISFNQGNGVYRFQFNEATSAYQVTYDASDFNADGMQDAWVAYFGLTGASALAMADADGDGITNHAEFRRGSSPLVVNRMSVVGNTAPLQWEPDAAALRMNWSDIRQRWEWAGSFPHGSVLFKFASGPGWGGANYGTGAGVAINTASTAGTNNISTNLTAGRYRFAFAETNGSYSIQSFPVSFEWREIHALAGASAWTNDTDKDGMTDLLEYALGGSPANNSDGRSLQALTNINLSGTNRLVLQWLQRTDGGSSLAITPETASDLAGSWSSIPSSIASNQAGVPLNHQRKEVSVPQDQSKKFLRLKVTGP